MAMAVALTCATRFSSRLEGHGTSVNYSSTRAIPGSYPIPNGLNLSGRRRSSSLVSFSRLVRSGVVASAASDSTGIETSSSSGGDSADLLETVKVFDFNGNGIPISDLWIDRTAVIAFARHFGCVFCRKRADYLASKKKKRSFVALASSSSSFSPKTKLYVSGLSFLTSEESLRNAFQNFEQLVEAEKCVQPAELSGENINITYRADGTHIAVGNRDDEMTILDVRKFKPINKRKFKYEDVMDEAGVALVLIGPGNIDQAKSFSEQTKFKATFCIFTGIKKLGMIQISKIFSKRAVGV